MSCKNSECGFFGTDNYNGYCSHCYAQEAKRGAIMKPNLTENIEAMKLNEVQNNNNNNKNAGTIPAPTQIIKNNDNNNNQIKESMKIEEKPSTKIDLKQSPEVEIKVQPIKKKSLKRKKKRCGICSSKVKVQVKCRCGGFFCNAHRMSDDHDCSFDYTGTTKNTLTSKLVNVKAAFDKLGDRI